MRPATCAALAAGLLAAFTLATPTLAHRSGCHRWHSCPSDTGSYTRRPALPTVPRPRGSPSVVASASAYPCQPGQIKGNRNSGIYHAPGQAALREDVCERPVLR